MLEFDPKHTQKERTDEEDLYMNHNEKEKKKKRRKKERKVINKK